MTFLGRPEIFIFLDIHNVGGKVMSLSKLSSIIQKDKEHFWTLPARTYLPAAGGEFLIGGITLKPGEHWSQSVHCFDLGEEEGEEEVNNIVSRFRIWRGPENSPIPASEANADLASEAKRFFDAHFNLRRGNYNLFIMVLSESNKILCIRGFNFTLFDSSIQMLKSISADYEHGEGLVCFTKTNPFPRLYPLEDEEARKIYQTMHHSLTND